MCLYKTHNEPRIAQNDIEVWKMLTSEGLSPFQNYPYHPGMNKPLKQKEIPLEQMHINDGYLHTYRDKETAESMMDAHAYFQHLHLVYQPYEIAGNNIVIDFEADTNAFEPAGYMVQRMIIPKGTVYYEDHSGDICAECLYWPEEETAAPKKD